MGIKETGTSWQLVRPVLVVKVIFTWRGKSMLLQLIGVKGLSTDVESLRFFLD